MIQVVSRTRALLTGEGNPLSGLQARLILAQHKTLAQWKEFRLPRAGAVAGVEPGARLAPLAEAITAVRAVREAGSGGSPLAHAVATVRPAILIVGAFSFFVNLLVFVGPLFMLQVYDRVLTSRSEATLVMLAGIAMVLLLSYALIEHARHQVLVQAGIRFDGIVSGPAFDAALQAALQSRGGQPAQIVRDVDSLREFIGGYGVITLLDAPWVPVFMVICFLFHPLIGLVAFAGAALLFVLAWLNERLTKQLLEQASLLNIASVERLSASLRNAGAIRGLGMAPAIQRRWFIGHQLAVHSHVRACELGGGLLAASKFLRMILQIALLGTGAWLVLHQEITAGVMFASSLIMGRALAPVEQAVAQWKAFVTARSAYARLEKTFAAFPAKPPRVRLPNPTGDLSVENLGVLAPGSQMPLIRGVSFGLAAGEVLAVVGPTGSGKSTLARAIVGAWPTAAGTVRIDGNDLRHWDMDQIGAALGYLPQDVELFEGTIAENIARFGKVEDDKVIAAALMASAHGVIQRLPNGYETAVGEDGVGLSGGQRQRVGLARALYGNPALVVLDEPNANLDGEGDAALVQAIRNLKQAGRTVVIVTHKPGLLAVVDNVLVMHGGQAVRFGQRDDILPQILGSNVPAVRAAA